MVADPDVMILVEADWDHALDKIDYLHNHTEFCNLRAVQDADYIKIQFSASTLGPRNGVAALDMVSAALHVLTGDATMNFQSGVDFFEKEMLQTRTASLRCPYVPKVEEKASSKSKDKIPAWAIPLIVVACLLCVLFFAGAVVLVIREKQGKPIFVAFDEGTKQSSATRTEQELSRA